MNKRCDSMMKRFLRTIANCWTFDCWTLATQHKGPPPHDPAIAERRCNDADANESWNLTTKDSLGLDDIAYPMHDDGVRKLIHTIREASESMASSAATKPVDPDVNVLARQAAEAFMIVGRNRSLSSSRPYEAAIQKKDSDQVSSLNGWLKTPLVKLTSTTSSSLKDGSSMEASSGKRQSIESVQTASLRKSAEESSGGKIDAEDLKIQYIKLLQDMQHLQREVSLIKAQLRSMKRQQAIPHESVTFAA